MISSFRCDYIDLSVYVYPDIYVHMHNSHIVYGRKWKKIVKQHTASVELNKVKVK